MNQAPATDAPDTVVDARAALLADRFGASVTPDQWDQVRTRIARSIAMSARLRAVSLGNADEPEIGFVPFRAHDRT